MKPEIEARLDLDWLTSALAVGGRIPEEAIPHLARSERVGRVIDLRGEDRDDEHLLRAHGITLLHLPTRDCCALSEANLERGVAWAAEQLRAGERVLIHCEHGIGRSALLALCVLVELGSAPLDALETAKTARPCVSPSPEQLESFRSWVRRRSMSRAGLVVPSTAELYAIAYRHLREGAVGSGTNASSHG